MEVGIDASGLQKDDDVHTTLALVHTYPDGDRDFSFYRNPGADMMLTEEATLKRVKKQENALILQPENPACEPKIFVGKDMENIHIRGRLMQLRKEF